ncbi:M16 family metallopeptidase [Xylanibacter ruminicola]|uniref:M16 family metallopeptidase n=1 Tax=Xylanibacter ruminicola TaxID=839 RepID=UPI00048F6654|nr:pitrilysin family protein [Xylanibacter ruminicola]
MADYNTYTLANGLRIIHKPSVAEVVYCGYQIAAGTRDELPGEEGMAHFCEHMTFKGTEHRNALQIINGLEQLGGDLNAFTNKEDTTFYAAVQKEHIAKAISLLTDMVFHSTYPQHEIDKEVEVICDEIESYNDSPAELIYDEFENMLFEGHPLGHNILGNANQLRTYQTADALRFVKRNYRPDNAIFFVYGNVDFKRVVRLVSSAMMGASSSTSMASPARSAGTASTSGRFGQGAREITKDIGSHQAHVMLGTRSYDIHHPLRIPLYLLNNILGGPSMNARLNLALRERNGLVYTVESTMVSYSDTGMWSIYFGCDPHDVRKCLRLVRRELDKVMQKPLSDNALQKAKQQLKGQIAIACDNREQFALDFGKSFLHYGWEKNVEKLFDSIDKVTIDDVQKVANELFAADKLSTLIFK